ncbi:DUF4936 family protein [Limnobacter sp.]|uniref:DUF4936 family protein n=1 Tax=Limnobacter sp. TaxID=2003368 RepID=UPI002FE02839
MTCQLFIYYRIPKTDIVLGLACARNLMESVRQQGWGQGKLFQREEADKPYFTLMEVIEPAAPHATHVAEFSVQIELLAARCFADFTNAPNRHIEVFHEVSNPCA